MTRIAPFILFCLLRSCGDGVTEPGSGEEFPLQYGQRIALENGCLILTFKALAEDSRCPVGAVCVWQGNARVVIDAWNPCSSVAAGSREDLSLNTTLDPKEIAFGKYRIKLVNVSPYPILNEEHPAGQYVIRLVVTQ